MVLREITCKVSQSPIARAFYGEFGCYEARRTELRGREEKDQGGRDGRDPWENVHHIDVTELECTFEIATWQREGVDKQVHTRSLDSVLATYWLYLCDKFKYLKI